MDASGRIVEFVGADSASCVREQHRKRLKRYLGTSGLVRYAIRTGLVSPQPWVTVARLGRNRHPRPRARYVLRYSIVMLEKGARENLYRIMTDVRAGAHQRSVSSGELGIVTIWVRAASVSAAMKKAAIILNDRRYSSIGTLHCYAEELAVDPLACVTEAERARERTADQLLAGYDALKESALVRADGLHEVWLGHVGYQGVTKPRRSQAA